MTWFNRIAAGGLVAAGIVVVGFGILIGMIAWSPTPIWDQWDAAAPEQLQNILAPHNEHRIALSRVIFLSDIALGHGTGVINLVFVFVFSGLTLALLVLLARWTWPKAELTRLAAAGAIAAAFLFSGFQYENFASGFQNQFTGVFFFAATAIAALCVAASREDRWRQVLIAVAALAAIVGVMCMANGLLIAPLLLVIAMLLDLRATAWIMALISAVSWTLYMRDYPASTGPGLSSALRDPLGFILNVLAYVGGPAPNSITVLNEPFPQKIELARVFGAVAMLSVGTLSVLSLLKPLEERPKIMAWAAIGLFVFASAAVTALGRSNFGEIAMLASRYGAGTALLWAVVMIWAVMLARGPALLSLSLVVVGGFSLLLAYTQISWVGAAQSYKVRKLDAEAALLVNADATPAYLGVYPAPERAPKVARWLQEKSLAMYYEPWRRLYGQTLAPAGAACAGEIKEVVSLAAASEPTWRVAVHGVMPDGARGVAVVTPQGQVVGMLIRGTTGDINNTLFGADDAPPMWGGFVHMKTAHRGALSLQVVDVDGRAMCQVDKVVEIDPVRSILLAKPQTVGEPAPAGGEVVISGTFPSGGFNEAVGPNPWRGRSWGSWGGDDKNVGSITIAASVEGLQRVAIPFVTGPTPAGSRIEIRVDGNVVESLPAPVDLMRWSAIEIAVPSGGKILEVIAEDASREWGGWIAVGEPHVVCADRCQQRACPQTFIHGEVVTGLSGGFVDKITQQGDTLLVTGWAGDTKTGIAVDHVIAVADNNRVVACLRPDLPRDDVASGTGWPGLAKSGFSLTAPAASRNGLALYSRQSDGSLARLNGP